MGGTSSRPGWRVRMALQAAPARFAMRLDALPHAEVRLEGGPEIEGAVSFEDIEIIKKLGAGCSRCEGQ